MKAFSKTILTGILCLAAMWVWADKIGYVDSDRIMSSYAPVKEAQTNFDNFAMEWQQELQQLEQELQEMQANYEAQELMLSDAKKQEKRAEINQKYQAYQQRKADIWGTGGLADQKNEALLAPILETINDVIQQIGNEGNYTIIFDAPTSGIVFANESIDVTDQVLDELNKLESAQTPEDGGETEQD